MLSSTGQLAKAFFWQFVGRVGEALFAQGLFPTDEEKRQRSTNRLGAMLLTGILALACTTLFAPVTLVAWILTAHGPGQRLLVYSAGGTRLGRSLTARASKSGALRQDSR